MGLEDRDWYREEYKKRQRAEEARERLTRPKSNRPPPDLSAYSKVIKQPRSIFTVLKYAALFVLLCLAIYGALAMIHHIQNPIKKQPQQQQQPNTKEKATPAVRYL